MVVPFFSPSVCLYGAPAKLFAIDLTSYALCLSDQVVGQGRHDLEMLQEMFTQMGEFERRLILWVIVMIQTPRCRELLTLYLGLMRKQYCA